jgi:hypothetical protein
MAARLKTAAYVTVLAAVMLTAVMAQALALTVAAPASGLRPGHCDPQAWAGSWASDYGPVALTVAGRTVAGAYEGGGRLHGVLDDTGCLLDGRWDEPPTRAAPDHAGPFEFTLGGDGGTWDGSWSYDGQKIWVDWNGRRATPAF